MLGRNRPVNVWLTLLIVLALVLTACGAEGGENTGANNTSGANNQPAGGQNPGQSTPGGAGQQVGGTVPTIPASTSQGEATVNISLSSEPPTLDPALSTALVDRQVLNSIMDKLVDLSPEGEIVPMLAESHDISEDRLTYTFKLRDGVTFHDGTKLDAEAVKFNLERGMTEESARRNELGAVKSVQAVDPTTVKITLKQPFEPLLSVLTDRAGMIASPTAVRKLGDNFKTQPVGSGPFQYKSRVEGNSITLVRNEKYWQEKLPIAKQIVYKIFTDPTSALVNLRSGQLDITDTLPARELPALQKGDQFRVINAPGLGYQGMYLNTQKAPFDNPKVRKAVDLLIDREALTRVAFQGTATPGHSPFAPNSFAHSESDKGLKPDVNKAKQLLSEAGAGSVSFAISTANSPTTVQVAQLIQNMLKQGGINATIEQLEFGTLLDKGEKGEFQALALGWSGRVDPDQNIYDFIVTGGRNNDAKYSNKKVDELLNQARQESDHAKRKALYDQVMAVLHEEVPYVYIYHPNNVFGLSSSVTGFVYVPDGIIRTVRLGKK